MSRNTFGPEINVFDAQDANGVSTTIAIQDYNVVQVFVVSEDSANLTLTAQMSDMESISDVDFSSAASTTNRYGNVAMYALSDATINEAITFAGTDFSGYYTINADNMQYLAFEVSSRSAGSVSVWVRGYEQ